MKKAFSLAAELNTFAAEQVDLRPIPSGDSETSSYWRAMKEWDVDAKSDFHDRFDSVVYEVERDANSHGIFLTSSEQEMMRGNLPVPSPNPRMISTDVPKAAMGAALVVIGIAYRINSRAR